MQIIHITAHNIFLGGGERLIDNWVSNSRHNSVLYSKVGGLDYGNPRFKTYETDEELAVILSRREADDLVVIHDPFLSGQEWLAQIKRKIWYVHGAFAYKWDIRSQPKPLFAISNFPPATKHATWDSIFIAPVHLGVDCVNYHAKQTPLSGKVVVGIVGRISEEKCPFFFFDFLDKFNIENPDHNFEFHFYGRGDEGSDYYKWFSNRISKTPRAYYKGFVGKNEAAFLYHRFDCLLVPSLSESGSFAILEAQSSGLKVFALNADGIPYHMVSNSALCANYNDMFNRLARFTRDEAVTLAPVIRSEMLREYNLKKWVHKLDVLAEMASFI